jgi:hypothetical protein
VSIQSAPTSRSWRRFLRFSMRGLIVVVLVVGVCMGWLVRVVRNSQVQRDAVATIERERGAVRYNGELVVWDAGPGWHEIPPGETWAPRWLVGLLGVDYLYHVTTASLFGWPGGAGMVSVGRLTSLDTLGLEYSGIGDTDLANLTGLTKLSSLDLHDTAITDAGLVHLRRLTNLLKLDLRHTQVTDAGVKELQQALPNLKIGR